MSHIDDRIGQDSIALSVQILESGGVSSYFASSLKRSVKHLNYIRLESMLNLRSTEAQAQCDV